MCKVENYRSNDKFKILFLHGALGCKTIHKSLDQFRVLNRNINRNGVAIYFKGKEIQTTVK